MVHIDNIKTNKKSIRLTLQFYVTGNCNAITIKIWDAKKHKSVYGFLNYHPIAGLNKVVIPMPLTPALMDISIGCDNNSAVDFTDMHIEHLPMYDGWMDEDLKSYITFIENIARDFKYLPHGTYKSKDGKYSVTLKNLLHDDDGSVSFTPLRVDRLTFDVEAATSKLNNYTVPMFVAACSHEYVHGRYDPKTEIPVNEIDGYELRADRVGVDIALQRGYPGREILAAFTNAFDDSPINKQRIDDIDTQIKNYQHNYGLTV